MFNNDLSILTGIEDFTQLESIECNCMNLHTADFSQNDHLTSINFEHGGGLPSNLTNVYVSDSLRYIDLSRNENISYVDYWNAPKLEYLDLSYCDLDSIDVSQNPELTHLLLWSNSLTSVDVSNNPVLTDLNVGRNDLLSQDVSQNPLLTSLGISFNSDISSIDVSGNSLLKFLHCGVNDIASLDLSNNTILATLNCEGNQLTELNLSQNDSITSLDCSYNSINTLQFGDMSSLTKFDCRNNQLSELDISQCTQMFRFSCANNEISNIQMPPTSNIRYFECQGNSISGLDLSMLSDVWRKVDCSDNNLNCLIVGPTTQPEDFSAMRNPDLTCIETSDDYWVSLFGWQQIIDPQSYFSQICANCVTGISEVNPNAKTLVRILDLLGREVRESEKNEPLIYQYSDGAIERRFSTGF